MASILWNLALSPMSFCNPKPLYYFRIWRLFLIHCEAIYESCYVHLECLVRAEPFSNVKTWAAPQTADWRCMCISIVSHYGFLILVGNGGYCTDSFCCSRAWDVIEFPKLKSWYQQNLELIELIMQSLETLTNLTQYQILKMYLEIQDLNWIQDFIRPYHRLLPMPTFLKLLSTLWISRFWSYCPCDIRYWWFSFVSFRAF